MKSYIIILAVVLAIPFAFTSCKEDEPKGVSLIGTWEETTFVSSGCTDPADNEVSTCTTSCERLVFTETTVQIGNLPVLNYTATGNQIIVVETVGSSTETTISTFTITDSTLVITLVDAAADGACINVITYRRIS